MKTLYMTKGLPAAGKSTAAKALVATQPGTKRFNKDDMRAEYSSYTSGDDHTYTHTFRVLKSKMNTGLPWNKGEK